MSNFLMPNEQITILHDNITLAGIMTSFHFQLRLSNGPRSTTTIIKHLPRIAKQAIPTTNGHVRVMFQVQSSV